MSINIVEVVKAHPIPIGLGVVVILLIVFSKGGSTSSKAASNAGAYLQAQKTASDANVALAGLNSQTTLGLGAQSVDNNRIAADSAISRMGIVAGMFQLNTEAQAEVAVNNSGNLLKSLQTTLANKENILKIERGYDIQKSTISANIEMNADKLSTQIRMNEQDNNAKLAGIGAATGGQLALLKEQGSIQGMLADKEYAFKSKTLPTVLQHNENMVRIGGANAAQLASIQTEANRTDAYTRASDAKNARNKGWLDSIVDIAGALFGG